MHILILASHPTSLVNFRGTLIKRLHEMQHTITVSAPNMSPAIQKQLERLGANTQTTPMNRKGINPFSDLVYLVTLIRLIRKTNPDRVLTYTIKPNIWGSIAAWLNNKKSISMVTGLGYFFTITDDTSIKFRIVRLISKLLYRTATTLNSKVVFQNNDDISDFIESGCLKDRSKAKIVNGSGVDLNHYKKSKLPKNTSFLMLSRILGNKGVREYAKASIETLQKNPKVEFRLVGPLEKGLDSISTEELKSWTDQGLIYAGPVDDVREEIKNCSVYVLPSYREGTPRSVLEAMAMQRPIITSDAPGCRETVLNGVNGWLVPIKDSLALANRMQWMIDNPQERVKMASQSYKLALEKYDVNAVNAVLIDYILTE